MTHVPPSVGIATLSDVQHRYGKQVALGGVSLQLTAGDLVGLIGPDGVGKSTLLGILAGAKRVQNGSVYLFGGDFTETRHRRAVCSRIAYMPQGLGRNLYPDLTVSENMIFFSRLFSQPSTDRKRRTAELLEATGLAPFKDRPAAKLSGGMRQKLGLCCALIHDPDLLILDEPTTGVDPLSRRQFWDLVDKMRAARPSMSVIVATAYMQEAERFNRIIAMNDGLILAEGTPDDIRRRTGSNSLDESFIALLPEALRKSRVRPEIGHRSFEHAPIAVSAIGLTRSFGTFIAVAGVTFTIKQGEIFVFLGSNGCGKTTTMKMLTGLLPVSGGQALLFGQPVKASDKALRYRVGYMSQLFSLYTELTVLQNLTLHARLYHIAPHKAEARIAELVGTFTLTAHVDTLAADLPLGIRQRLALAVAVINKPQLLILDEPTSGVDPLARDQFWKLLGDLSRRDGVTIFISTHFMNEAAWCDQILLMNGGRTLITGSPAEVVDKWGGTTLEAAFISCLEAATSHTQEQAKPSTLAASVAAAETSPSPRYTFSVGRLYAYAARESIELLRDPVRLCFAVLGTAFLMIVLGYGMNTDVDHLTFAVFDQDRSSESRSYIEAFSGSSYFSERAPIHSERGFDRALDSGSVELALNIPAGFGRDVRRGRPAQAGAWIDGAMPFLAQTIQGYVEGVQETYVADLATSSGAVTKPLATVVPRYLYNQSFDSIKSLVPSGIALELALVPAILMALSVVREKEFGSITNLYVTPVTRLEFAVGKQLPYVVVTMASYVLLLLIAIFLFDVPVKGSIVALTVGTLIYVFTTTGYGLLISAFSKTQIAALFGTAILTVLPATQFAGIMSPVSSLTGFGAVIGRLFPMSTYLPIAIGTFDKSLGFSELAKYMLLLALFIPGLVGLSVMLLPKQER